MCTPARILSSVDLPAPFRPNKPTESPALIDKSRLCSACVSPKYIEIAFADSNDCDVSAHMVLLFEAE